MRPALCRSFRRQATGVLTLIVARTIPVCRRFPLLRGVWPGCRLAETCVPLPRDWPERRRDAPQGSARLRRRAAARSQSPHRCRPAAPRGTGRRRRRLVSLGAGAFGKRSHDGIEGNARATDSDDPVRGQFHGNCLCHQDQISVLFAGPGVGASEWRRCDYGLGVSNSAARNPACSK